jgi:dTDP-4-amino-4,6-dideoxygalactose transaminase
MIPLFKVFMAEEAVEAAQQVLGSGYIGQGPKVEEFEERLRQAFESPVDVLTTNSCTSALDLALHMIGVRPGDIVVSTPQTCTATNTMIVNRGARIAWADVDSRTGLINPESVGKLVERWHPKAIMAVDWGGATCDYDALTGFGVPVIEDAAHAFGSSHKGKPIASSEGTRADYICWSFQAIKHLTTIDGGALVCPDAKEEGEPVSPTERARLLRWFGLDRRSSASFRCSQDIQEAGYKYHMNDVSAAVGIENLKEMGIVIDRHRRHAAIYGEELKDLKGIELPPQSSNSSWWLYTILVDKRDAFEIFMKDRGIDVSQVHARNDRHMAFKRASIMNAPLYGLEAFSARQVSIPVGWWLNSEDLDKIIDAVKAWSKAL